MGLLGPLKRVLALKSPARSGEEARRFFCFKSLRELGEMFFAGVTTGWQRWLHSLPTQASAQRFIFKTELNHCLCSPLPPKGPLNRKALQAGPHIESKAKPQNTPR